MKTQILKVSGMTCGGCVSSVTKVLESVAGVEDVEVSLAAGQATVRYDESRANREQMVSAVTSAGFGVVSPNDTAIQAGKGGCCA